MSTKARGELTYCGVDAGPCFDVFSTSQIHSRSVDGQASVRYVRQALRAHACSWHQTRLATSEGLCAIRGIIPMPSANAQRSCAEVLRGLLWPIPAGRSWIALAGSSHGKRHFIRSRLQIPKNYSSVWRRHIRRPLAGLSHPLPSANHGARCVGVAQHDRWHVGENEWDLSTALTCSSLQHRPAPHHHIIRPKARREQAEGVPSADSSGPLLFVAQVLRSG